MAAAGAFQSGFARQGAETAALEEITYYDSLIGASMRNQTLTDLAGINVESENINNQNDNRLFFKHQIASQQAGYAGRNVSLKNGEPISIMRSTQVIEAFNRDRMNENTANKMFNLKMQKINFQIEESVLREKRGRIDPFARGQKAFMGSILSTAGSVGSAGGFGGGTSPAGMGGGSTGGVGGVGNSPATGYQVGAGNQTKFV